MTVDLNTCVPGQLVGLRNGNIVEYTKRNQDDALYPHKIGDERYTNDGYYFSCKEEDDDDVVKIFPLTKPEQPKTDKHPSVAWWESCPWITDRKPTHLDGDTYGRVYIKSSENEHVLASNWNAVEAHEKWIHVCGWQPLNQTPKEKALTLIAKQDAGSWTPTPDDWDVIRKGLEE
jgi:hypothetical protein